MTETKKSVPVFKIIFLLVGLIGIVIAGMSALGPSSTKVERSIYLNANQQDVFDFLLDFEHYHLWQIAAERDSSMVYEVTGPKAEGATYSWSGNELVGKGQLEITKADPYRLIEMQIKYVEPWEANALYKFSLQPDDLSTEITWRYEAKNSYFSRINLLFMNLDKLLGSEMEEGLNRMRAYYIKMEQMKKTQ